MEIQGDLCLMLSGESSVLSRQEEGRMVRYQQADGPQPYGGALGDPMQRITKLIYRVAGWLSGERGDHRHPRDNTFQHGQVSLNTAQFQ